MSTKTLPPSSQPCNVRLQQAYFFFPFLLLAPAEFVDVTLEARDGAAELALLPLADLTLSSALF